MWSPFRFLYMQIYLLNTCKLDWEENLFDFYVESIAFRIKILMSITSFAHAIYHTSKHFCTNTSPERACRGFICPLLHRVERNRNSMVFACKGGLFPLLNRVNWNKNRMFFVCEDPTYLPAVHLYIQIFISKLQF